MYKVTKRFSGFSCCFRQWRAASHCRHLHGYALEFKVVFGAPTLDFRNWVVDFGGFDQIKQDLARLFDHTLVVAESDPDATTFAGLALEGVANVQWMPEVGCELFAKHVFWLMDKFVCAQAPANGLRVISVECIENGNNSAIYTQE